MEDPDRGHENRRKNISIDASIAGRGRVGADINPTSTGNDAETAPALRGNDAVEAVAVSRLKAAPPQTKNGVEAAPVETGIGNSLIAASQDSPPKPLSSYSHALRKKAESVVTPALLSLSAWFFGYFGLSFAWIVVLFLLLLLLRRIRAEKEKTPRRKTIPMTTTTTTFPDEAKKRVEWVNQIFGPLWPFVGGFAAKLIRGKIESQIREKLDNFRIREFSFEEISLGDVAPSVDGVKVNMSHF